LRPERSGRTVKHLLLTVVAMFGFGFALVPLYDVICNVTGLNGKTGGKYEVVADTPVDSSRVVTVQFLANNNADMPWDFRPETRTLKVRPGEMNETTFFARNPADTAIYAQAVPSVTPSYAAEYLHKTECFCFNRQHLAAGEAINLPLRFIVDRDIPGDITTLTLSYTLFNITDQVHGQLAAN
jgi:cytochrome c oxidase assembly protein subunit 11